MEIADKVQEIAEKVRAQKANIATEEGTKNAFVMPFINSVLGYDVFNPSEVIPEFIADMGITRLSQFCGWRAGVITSRPAGLRRGRGSRRFPARACR
jgi:hypothetical protein